MTCKICDIKTEQDFCDKHLGLLKRGWTVNGWQIFNDKPDYIGNKKFDETDRRLNQTVRANKGKNINSLRSYMKNGKWNYKYIK